MQSNDGPVCLFCNMAIEEQSEHCRISLEAEWSDASGTYWCHGSCLQEAAHPATPLYLLSLFRDAAFYGNKQPRATDADHVANRALSEREAFRAARYFIEQFNKREKSEGLALLVSWMAEGTWDDPLETSDPAQWHDWVQSVDRVLADREVPPIDE